MSEAPKKVWIDDDWDTYTSEPSHKADQYIRADIVEEMREALVHISNSTMARTSIKNYAQAALKRLEEA